MAARDVAPFSRAMNTLAGLSDDNFEELKAVLRLVNRTGERAGSAERLASVVGGGRTAAIDVINSILAIVAVGADEDVAANERYAKNLSKQPDDLPDELRQVLSSRLQVLLADEEILICAKAARLEVRHERVLLRAEILTDARPVFGRSVGPPAGFVVWHTLQLFLRGDRVFDYALDRNDLDDLLKQIERAIEKHDSLSSWISTGNVPLMDPSAKFRDASAEANDEDEA